MWQLKAANLHRRWSYSHLVHFYGCIAPLQGHSNELEWLTFRALDWLNNLPLPPASRWLGLASLQTTLVYLQILSDPTGHMERVP